jgi:hypothetical protein
MWHIVKTFAAKQNRHSLRNPAKQDPRAEADASTPFVVTSGQWPPQNTIQT